MKKYLNENNYEYYYKNPLNRENYRNQLKQITNEVTYNKIMILLKKFNLK